MGKFFKPGVTKRSPQEAKDQAPKYRDIVTGPLTDTTSFFCPTLAARNQGDKPDCTGYGTAGQQDRRVALDIPAPFLTSPLYIFIRGGGGPNGAVISNILQALFNYGICKESTFPISLLTDINNLPAISATADAEAANYKCGKYALVQTVAELKDAIEKGNPDGGNPNMTGPAAVIGVAVYSNSFENAANGVILAPNSVSGDQYEGDHEVCADGFDDNMVTPAFPDPGYFRFPNSWGAEWGDPNTGGGGYGYIHYSLVTNPDLMLEMWGSIDAIQSQPQPQPAPVPELTTLTLSGTIPTLSVGQGFDVSTLTLTGTDQNDNPFDITGITPVWGVADQSMLETPGSWTGTVWTPDSSGEFCFMAQINGVNSNNLYFTVAGTVPTGNSTTATFTLVINPAPLAFITTSLPGGTTDTPYSAEVSATGGVEPYTFACNNLPAGLTMDDVGNITGTPTTGGTYSLSLSVTDEMENTAYATLTLTIAQAVPDLEIVQTPWPQGTIGQQYSTQVTADGGIPPYHDWSATGLAPGLSIDSGSGLVSGTPTAYGANTVVVTVYDSATPANKASASFR